MLSMLLAVVTLHATNPTSLPADSMDCSGTGPACHLTGENFYYALVGSDGTKSLLRAHSYVPGQVPAIDTLQVPDSPAATYWAVPVNAAGESQCVPKGFTVGVPAVGVGTQIQNGRPVYYDLAGRRVLSPLRAGVYFESVLGKPGVRRVVIR